MAPAFGCHLGRTAVPRTSSRCIAPTTNSGRGFFQGTALAPELRRGGRGHKVVTSAQASTLHSPDHHCRSTRLLSAGWQPLQSVLHHADGFRRCWNLVRQCSGRAGAEQKRPGPGPHRRGLPASARLLSSLSWTCCAFLHLLGCLTCRQGWFCIRPKFYPGACRRRLILGHEN